MDQKRSIKKHIRTLAGGISPILLPDGGHFKSWERPLKFSRTYYVNQSHPKASDDNPGTEDLPFSTINRAAQKLRPGERVVVAAGVYRERVSPARSGTGPAQMISYEAAPGAEVILSGSLVLKGPWTRSKRRGSSKVKSIWSVRLSRRVFEGENPFAEINLTDRQIDRCMVWAVPIKGKPPITLRRGLVFQNGRRLKQVGSYDALTRSSDVYWVEKDGLTLHVRPMGDIDPGTTRFEATVRGLIFAPKRYGLGYIRVKGFTIQHSGNCFPRPQQGALSTQRGHHWIIDGNTVRQCNAIGIDIGDQFDISGPKLAEGGRHIVRHNRVLDCGIGGIEGKTIEHTLIEGNVIRRCGWHKLWLVYETGGIKVHCTRSCVLRHNLITDSIGAPGIWMDYANVNSRCTANVVINAECPCGGIFMEASQEPNGVDNNFVWGTRGNGIYQHDCDELTIAHNLVANSTEAGVKMQICQGRKVCGRLSTAKRNRILNNILIDNDTMLSISDPDNLSDFNVFADSRKRFDLAAWRADKGWDKHSLTARIQADFDPKTLKFKWSTADRISPFPRVKEIAFDDLLGRSRQGKRVLPGPFATAPTAPLELLAAF